jgi:hypothetical protein
LQKLIKNNWHCRTGETFERARILSHEIHPEGFDVERLRFFEDGSLTPMSNVGHIISVLRGKGRLHVASVNKQPFYVGEGIHVYLPPFLESGIDVSKGTELLCVSSASSSQARGNRLLLRDEAFVSACASGAQSLRWILTPQYLSRRIFLHHDPILLSKSGNPVSWFRTTMFDVTGLPHNEDGEPVFKMSYNSRTEFNVCYDVHGTARVRMAKHPYNQLKQVWGSWFQLDSDTTYHLNEAAGGPEDECYIDEKTGIPQFLRNKHEVQIVNGHVTLFCLFDPAPTGVECHRPGEYSDYEPISQVLGTRSYETYRQELARYDDMVDQLSTAKALGDLNRFKDTPFWETYLIGREIQGNVESVLAKTIASKDNGRSRILEPWMQTVPVS